MSGTPAVDLFTGLSVKLNTKDGTQTHMRTENNRLAVHRLNHSATRLPVVFFRSYF